MSSSTASNLKEKAAAEDEEFSSSSSSSSANAKGKSPKKTKSKKPAAAGSSSRSRSRRSSTSRKSPPTRKGRKHSAGSPSPTRTIIDDDNDDDDDNDSGGGGGDSNNGDGVENRERGGSHHGADERAPGKGSKGSKGKDDAGKKKDARKRRSPRRTRTKGGRSGSVDDDGGGVDSQQLRQKVIGETESSDLDGGFVPRREKKGSAGSPSRRAIVDDDDDDDDDGDGASGGGSRTPRSRGSSKDGTTQAAAASLSKDRLATSSTIKKKPSYFAAFMNSRSMANQDQATMTWHEACCGSTEMKKSRSLRLQAMHSVFNSIFTLVFIVLLAFALLWLERYYVNYFRASSVLLNLTAFENQLAEQAWTPGLFTTSASDTTEPVTSAACAAEDCFAGYSCDELQQKGLTTATCDLLEHDYGCSCSECLCPLDAALAPPTYVVPEDEDLRYTDDAYDYTTTCIGFAAVNASCAATCSCTDQEVAEYCAATFDTQGGANDCVMLPIRSDGSCIVQLKSVEQARQLGLDRSPRFEAVVGIEEDAAELLYTHRTGCCQDQRDGSRTDAKGTFYEALNPTEECQTILFDPVEVGLADSVKVRLALSIYAADTGALLVSNNTTTTTSGASQEPSVAAGIVITMPIKFFAVSPGLTSSAFIVFALVIVFAVIQAATNERALARLRKIGNKIPCCKGLSSCFRGAAGFLDVLHMFIDVVTLCTFLISLGVLASWMRGQLGSITECVNASDFSALSFSPYYYTIPSWNFLDNETSTMNSAPLVAAQDAKDAGDLPPDACDAAAINHTIAYLALLDRVVDEMVQTMTICGDPAVRCEVDEIYMETYYFSIQFVIYLVGAAAISLFFVIVFDIGWVVARFMIARVTFVQENACRSCQRVFDISKLPRKCALCTFYYCRKCTFQTRIIPGYTKPQHVCTMCMLQSRQSIIRELEDICEAGARKNRAVVGLVHLVIQAVQSSRAFNLTLEKYDRFLNNGKRSTAISPMHVVPTKDKKKKNGSNSKFGETKEPEFRIHVTRFRGRRIFAELREVVGYLWQETFVQDVKASTQVLDDGFGGVLDPKDTHREASLRELLRHAVKEMLRNLDDRSIMHRFMGGLMKHYHIRFLHSEFDALQVQAALQKKGKRTRTGSAMAKEIEAAAAAAVADDDHDATFYRSFLRRAFPAEWWVAMAKALSSYADRNAFSETRRTQMKAIDDKADRSFKSTFELVPPHLAIVDGSRSVTHDGGGNSKHRSNSSGDGDGNNNGATTTSPSTTAAKEALHQRMLAEALHAFWLLPPAKRTTYFSSQADIACRAWYESLLLADNRGNDDDGDDDGDDDDAPDGVPATQQQRRRRRRQRQQGTVGGGIKFSPNVERMYFDRGRCQILFRQKGRDVSRVVRVVVFQDFFAVFSDKSVATGRGSKLTARPTGDSQASASHLLFMFFFKELDLIDFRSLSNQGLSTGAMGGPTGLSDDDGVCFRAYDLDFMITCHKPPAASSASRQRINSSEADALGPIDEVELGKLRDLFNLRCVDRNLLCELHPFESTFPERDDCLGRLYVNGAEYFDDVAHAMQGAQHTIMIADWCISPYIYLQRPHHQRDPARGGGHNFTPRPGGLDPAFRLDNLLQTKAAQGVQVYILLFKELSMVLDLHSEEAEAYFRSLHENIHVVRHCPTKLFDRTGVSKSWSHHQKFVVVDNITAFVGGIDLCAGRFDTHLHPLFDPLPPYLFPGGDYKNPQVVTDSNRLHKETPYPPVMDLFSDIRDPLGNTSRPDVVSIRRGRLRSGSVKNIDLVRRESDKALASKQAQETKTGLAADSSAGEDAQKRLPMPRMPWHDIHSCVFGQAAQDAAENFILRWNAHNAEDAENPKHQPIWPKPFFKVAAAGGGGATANSAASRGSGGGNKEGTPTTPLSYTDRDMAYGATNPNPTFPCKVQVLRSAAEWSGWRTIENSIQRAYIDAINNSKHLVYIENQFFISKSLGMTGYSNTIAKALQARVVNAIDQNADGAASGSGPGNFKLVIVIPLHMDGALGDSSTTAVLQHMQNSIFQDEMAFFKPLTVRLMEKYPDTYRDEESALEGLLSEYVMFTSLQQWQRHPVRQQFVATSQIYIHSKLLIVDDRIAIVGSANINDRSMIGDRDTELAVRIEGVDLVDGEMDGRVVKVSKHIRMLRERLWRQNFGLEYSSGDGGVFPAAPRGSQSPPAAPKTQPMDPPGFFADPVKVYGTLYQRARGNTDFYSEMFPQAVPQNNIQTRKEVKDFIWHHTRDNFFQYMVEITDEETMRRFAAKEAKAAALRQAASTSSSKQQNGNADKKSEASQLRRTTEKRLRAFESAVKGHGVLWPILFARKYDFNKEMGKAQMAQILVNPMFFV